MEKFISKENLIRICMILVFGIIFLTSIRTCQSNKRDASIYEQNLKAARAEIKQLRDKNNNLYYEKEIYITKASDLEEINGEMYQSIRALKEKINSGLSTEITYHDTVWLNDSVFIPQLEDTNIYNTVQKFDDGTLSAMINQRIRITPITLYTDNIDYSLSIPVEAYFTNDYKIILKSKNQKVVFSDVDAFISPDITKLQKKKRWGLGVQAGVGVIGNSSIINFGCYVGVGISYNLFVW